MSVPAFRSYTNRWSIAGFVFSLIIMIVQLGFIFTFHGYTYVFIRIALGALFVVMFTGAGHFVDVYVYGTFFHKEVVHPIQVSELVYQRHYWLNGETKVQYLGTNGRGQLMFYITGISDPRKSKDHEIISAWDAEKYISLRQES